MNYFLKKMIKEPFDNIIFAKYLVSKHFKNEWECSEFLERLKDINDNHFVKYVAWSIRYNGCYDYHILMDLEEKIHQAFGFSCSRFKTFFKIRRYIRWATSKKDEKTFNWCRQVELVLSEFGTKPAPKYNKIYVDKNIPFDFDWIIDWEKLYNKYKDCNISYPELSNILNLEGTNILKKIKVEEPERVVEKKTTWKDEFEKFINIAYPEFNNNKDD